MFGYVGLGWGLWILSVCLGDMGLGVFLGVEVVEYGVEIV